jgi:hypothetical protein
MSKHKGKGFSIVYIPPRGNSKTYYIPTFIIYSLSLIFVLAFVFSYQFFQHFTQLRTEYIKMNSFSMEEKQLIMSEELFAVQQVLGQIRPVLEQRKNEIYCISRPKGSQSPEFKATRFKP